MQKQPTKPKKPVGRPKVVIDWNQVGKMLEAGASAEGIAATIGCDRDTLYNRCKTDLKMDFSAFSQQKKAKGDELLRTKQFQVAMTGDKTMLIWLGKQRLAQRDKTQTEVTVTDARTMAEEYAKALQDELKYKPEQARELAAQIYGETVH